MKILNILILSILVSSCVAYKVPIEDMTNTQSEIVLPRIVKISTEYTDGNTEDWLSEALVRQKLSEIVLTSSNPEVAPYRMSLESNYTGKCFSEPMLTVLTLGIIPSIGCAEVGYKVALSDSNNKELISVNASKEVQTVFGISALFLVLSPSWVAERGIVEYEAYSIVDELSANIEIVK